MILKLTRAAVMGNPTLTTLLGVDSIASICHYKSGNFEATEIILNLQEPGNVDECPIRIFVQESVDTITALLSRNGLILNPDTGEGLDL